LAEWSGQVHIRAQNSSWSKKSLKFRGKSYKDQGVKLKFDMVNGMYLYETGKYYFWNIYFAFQPLAEPLGSQILACYALRWKRIATAKL
jgi:hypothetical protein